ncbi:serine protease FAM111A-like [Limanda limanda]|uniref:serine protease FAM111A-like n=1 Tax=Limanda limanda TaxID=27771 RepID=UPI0029C6DB47|nr:serine protease FAM111A-like [Limanda limanda]
MTIFAYKGETVKQALRRDARFQHIVFKQKCVLSTDDFVVNMSNLVDDFENLLNGEITDPFRVGKNTLPMTEVLRVEYGKNAQTCTDVKTMKELMGFSNSVCQVRLHDGSTGSGFLLFDRFVLTNAHVVNAVYNESDKKLNKKVIVHFSYESQYQREREQDSVADVEVEEVAGFEFTEDVYDWALLKLRAGVKLPNGLLNKCGDLNQSHGVRIIGHPDGGVKKIETCLSIAPERRKKVVEKSRIKHKGNTELIQDEAKNSVKNKDNTSILITDRYFKNVAKQVQRRKNVVTYKTCFYEGASGSPVFDQDCNVLAMHSGGYKFRDTKTDTIRSAIEFGYSLSDIIERINIQLVERKVADETFKEFFEFCQKEEPVPMETC